MEAWVAEVVELLILKAALVGAVAAEQEKKRERAVVEEEDRSPLVVVGYMKLHSVTPAGDVLQEH
jgi:hypothetical protein